MSDSTKFDCVVIGGGYVGIFAGLVLVNAGYRVAIIEREMKVGGLLQSSAFVGKNGAKFEFDYGVHYLLLT